MKGIAAGVLAGIVGAVIWALVAYITGFETGLLAWGIGACVGTSVAWGSQGGSLDGTVAVIISIIAIFAGKYISDEILIDKRINEIRGEAAAELDDDNGLILWVAGEIVGQREDSGQAIGWPEGFGLLKKPTLDDYPEDIAEETKTKWASMTDGEKAEFKAYVSKEIDFRLNEIITSIQDEGILSSFSPLDILFLLLAIGTSYKFASGSANTMKL